MMLRLLVNMLMFIVCFSIHPIAVKEHIIDSRPGQLLYLIGQRNDGPSEESKEQFRTLMKTFEDAEKESEQQFHVLVEQSKFLTPDGGDSSEAEDGQYAGDMNAYVMREARRKNLRNSTFENIETRYLSGKATTLFGEFKTAEEMLEQYKKGRNGTVETEITIETYRNRLNEQGYVAKNTEQYESQTRFLEGVLQMALREKFNVVDNSKMSDASWLDLEHAVTYKKGAQLMTIDQLTFNDCLDEFQSQITDLETYVQGLQGIEKQEILIRIEGASGITGIRKSFISLQETIKSHGVKYDDTLYAFFKALNSG